jgi:hypothetical protein
MGGARPDQLRDHVLEAAARLELVDLDARVQDRLPERRGVEPHHPHEPILHPRDRPTRPLDRRSQRRRIRRPHLRRPRGQRSQRPARQHPALVQQHHIFGQPLHLGEHMRAQ